MLLRAHYIFCSFFYIIWQEADQLEIVAHMSCQVKLVLPLGHNVKESRKFHKATRKHCLSVPYDSGELGIALETLKGDCPML